MNKDDPKLSPWMIVAAIGCCALPLLLLSGGSAFVVGLVSSNTLLIIFALIVVGIAVWLFIKKKNV